MLTIQLIREETERVVKGLEKKNFSGAREAIDQVLSIDKLRRETQQRLDTNLSEAKKLAAEIGKLMKQGQRDEAEQVKATVAQLKETNKQLEQDKANAEHDLTTLLCQIPNIPYDEVPEGKAAEDNHVVKSNLKECDGTDTVGNWTCNPMNGEAKLPHWELAKKYNLIDFDLGVKITGAGFPVYIGQGARLQRALINFFLDEARKSGYTELMPPTVVNAASGYGTGQLPDKEGQMYHCEVDDFYLIPTAEVPVTNIYRDVILDEKDLPIKNCAYTECFRREAGSYGKDVRGLNRLHEFSKIEIVRIDTPEHSKESHTGASLPHSVALRWRPKFHQRHLLRFRGIFRGPAALAGGIVGIQFRHLSGQPSEVPLPPLFRQEDRALPHPERFGPCPAAHCGLHFGEQPDARRYPCAEVPCALLRF